MEKMKKMKNKISFALTALVPCMGAFFMPMAAHAQADTKPPDIHAVLQGNMLHIEASDDLSGVEAVFIGASCIPWEGEDAMDVDFRDYAGSGNKAVGVYAVDAAGNRSVTVEMENPFYEAAAFTPDGQATVLDNVTDGDGKEFYTITTPEGNIFYLVIDRERDSDNVYFLNAVTEKDLMALAEKDLEDGTVNESAIPEIKVCTCMDKCQAGMVDVTCPVCINDLTACIGKEVQQPEAEEEETGGTKTGGAKKENSGTMPFVFLAMAAAAGAGYYLKIYKPKHELDDAEDLDDLLDDGDGPEVNEEETDLRVPGQTFVRQTEIETEPRTETAVYDSYPDGGNVGSVYDNYPDGGNAGADYDNYPDGDNAGSVYDGYPDGDNAGADYDNHPSGGYPSDGYPDDGFGQEE